MIIVGARMGAPTVHDGTEGMTGMANGCMEHGVSSLDSELEGIEVTKVHVASGEPSIEASVFVNLLAGNGFRLEFESAVESRTLTEQGKGHNQSILEGEQGRSDPSTRLVPGLLGVVSVKGVDKGIVPGDIGWWKNLLGGSLLPLSPSESPSCKEEVVEPHCYQKTSCVDA